jgi:catechol 2,3-dioxygenase-like lactoylglutathione lyase family enzyme
MMEQRISFITLGVEDLARARRFYEEGLGWAVAFEHAEIAMYQLPGLILSLLPLAELARDAGADIGRPGGLSISINERSQADVDATLATVAAAGGRLVSPARDKIVAYTGYFADPDGHLWEVAHNPSVDIAEDGSASVRPH